MTDETNKRRDVLISKALSYLLRHGAVKEKLDIDSSGYVPIAQILNHQRLKSFKTTREDLDRIVKENDKQRFAIDESGDLICANQGHSLSSVSQPPEFQLMTQQELSNLQVFHGTYIKKLAQIKQTGGLSRMKRNHIHLTCDEYKSISGVRVSADCLVYIDTDLCIAAGLKFYKSANDVILTPGDSEGLIKWEYVSKVIELRKGKGKSKGEGEVALEKMQDR
ncbi:uncharacterized protein LODBEIA_P21310 [Lodderomyces beijingensis]|uniref:2'-phosphotransferase n=1 Tax=Lodderomyces beijingensis TaxID=1775926 RepID=A0ABP0ZNZ7_9ASCO